MPPAKSYSVLPLDSIRIGISIGLTSHYTNDPLWAMVLPTNFGRRNGDLDEMVKQRNICALVILNPIGFFYDKGQPRGVMYEALEELQKFANQKLNTGALNVKVTFLPMRLDQVDAALTEGVGDMIASGIVVTPEREKRVAFSTPIQTDVTQIIVTRTSQDQLSTLAYLTGKEVYANPLTTYYQNLQKANEQLQNSGKAPMILEVSRLRWKWRRRSFAKIAERTYEKRAQALHRRREGSHPEATPLRQYPLITPSPPSNNLLTIN